MQLKVASVLTITTQTQSGQWIQTIAAAVQFIKSWNMRNDETSWTSSFQNAFEQIWSKCPTETGWN
jgi:hypothetical protein